MARTADEAQPNAALRERRLRRGWSQQELADAVNDLAAGRGVPIVLTANDVSRWERGIVVTPQPLTRRLLAELLQVAPEELGFGTAADPDPGPDVRRSRQRWIEQRRSLNQRRRELTRVAAALYPEGLRLADTGMLLPPAWRLPEPVDLTAVTLAWREDAPPPRVDGHEDESRDVRPLRTPERRYERYHRALRDLDPPRLLENRLCYRLLDVDWSRPDAQLSFGSMCYFDAIDVGEAAAHELASRHRGDQRGAVSWDDLPFRRLLRDPLDVTAWPLLLSVSTLTIRASPAGATFLLLRRNPARVAVAGGMLSVLPTGVFQPASILPAPRNPDFNLWHNVMREYSEEFLGNPEHDGNGPPVDYAGSEPFRALEAARATGALGIWALGVGIDALNLVADVLTVAVFDARTFDDVFRGLVTRNDEGSVERADADQRRYAFDGATVDRLLGGQPVAPSGAACLRLAWEHRGTLLARA